MLCKLCLGKIDNCINGTEKIEVCSNCGIVTEDNIVPESIHNPHSTSHYSNLFYIAPIQKLSLSKIDGLIEKLNIYATKQKCHDLIVK